MVVVGFDSDLFKVTCEIHPDNFTIKCVSKNYRVDLVEKLINFTVFAEFYALENTEVPTTNLR